MVGAVRGIDPETGNYYDDTKRYVEALKLSPEDRNKIFEGNARRVVQPAEEQDSRLAVGERQETTMPEIPRLNGVIKALEQGKIAFCGFASVGHRDRDRARRLALRRRRVRDGARADEPAGAARRAPVHAGPPPDRPGRDARAEGDADGAHSAERRRDESVDRQAGARHRRVRHHLPAREHRRRGAQRRQRLPLSAPAERAPLRSARHPRRRAGAGGALLGALAAGVLRAGRRVAAGAAGRDPGDHPVRGHAGDREPAAHPRAGARASAWC